jgi:hypothetical protein
MPVYFFHFLHHRERVEDEEGLDLPDLEAAKIEAIASVRDAVSVEARFGDTIDTHMRVEIVDAEGRILTLISFADAICLNGKQ